MSHARTRLLAIAAAPLLFIAACDTDSTDSDNATSTENAAASDGAMSTEGAAPTTAGPAADLEQDKLDVETKGDAPVITYDGAPISETQNNLQVKESFATEVEAGDGDEVKKGHDVGVKFVAVNGATGQEIASTFASDETLTIPLADAGQQLPIFTDNLIGKKVGSKMLLGSTPADGFGEQGQPQMGVGPEDSMIFYMEVASTGKPLDKAEGKEVEPKEGLPTVEADGESAAKIDVEGVEPPEKLVVQPLIEGEGEEVKAGQTVKVHYTGVKLSDGEGFDDSYQRGEPASFPIGVGQVIPGWDEGLVGQKVGSRVLMVVPADQAYGEAPPEGQTAEPGGPGELAGEDLVFVVDILGAQ